MPATCLPAALRGQVRAGSAAGLHLQHLRTACGLLLVCVAWPALLPMLRLQCRTAVCFARQHAALSPGVPCCCPAQQQVCVDWARMQRLPSLPPLAAGAYNRTLTPFGFQAEERTYWQVRWRCRFSSWQFQALFSCQLGAGLAVLQCGYRPCLFSTWPQRHHQMNALVHSLPSRTFCPTNSCAANRLCSSRPPRPLRRTKP